MSAVSQGIAYLKRDISRKEAIIKDIDDEMLELASRMKRLQDEKAIAAEALLKFNEALKTLEAI